MRRCSISCKSRGEVKIDAEGRRPYKAPLSTGRPTQAHPRACLQGNGP
jgi:hypothetical protein